MRSSRIIRRIILVLMIGAVPVGAVLWLLATPGWGVLSTIAALLVGVSLYAVTPPPLGSRPGKPDPNDLSTSPIMGGRATAEELRLWSHGRRR